MNNYCHCRFHFQYSVFLGVCDMSMWICSHQTTTDRTLYKSFIIQSWFAFRRHGVIFWRHSSGYSISTSPAPIIYFGLFSWRKRFYKPNLLWQVWWRRANKSPHGAPHAAVGSPLHGWILLWFDSWLPHSPLCSLCVCDPPCPSARRRK